MSFIATANPPSAAVEPAVTNNGWFPDLLPSQVRDACRLDGSVTPGRFLPALLDAMLHVNTQLAAWADEQRSRWGYASLADVPAPHVGGESAKVLYYRRAVAACLQADLLETYRGMASLGVGKSMGTGKSVDRGYDELQQHADDYRRQLRWALNDLQGVARCTVDLL